MIRTGSKIYSKHFMEEKDFLNYFGIWSSKVFTVSQILSSAKFPKKFKNYRECTDWSIKVKIQIQKVHILEPIFLHKN